jgi:hypothetical protein
LSSRGWTSDMGRKGMYLSLLHLCFKYLKGFFYKSRANVRGSAGTLSFQSISSNQVNSSTRLDFLLHIALLFTFPLTSPLKFAL